MSPHELPADWSVQRDELRRIATHVVAHAQQQVTGHFALMALPGGFGTPQFGDDRQRVRVAGGSLFVETARGRRDDEETATTTVHPLAGSSISSLCAACGIEPDPELWVGGDTPPLGDPDRSIDLDPRSADVLGDWYSLGNQAMDAAIASLPNPQASVVRLWPEHFDLGVDVAVDTTGKPGVRTNLGAAAGDGFHEPPYLYVGPWGAERPGASAFWNAPFGAVLGFDEVVASDDPQRTATEFFRTGIAHLRA